MNNDFFEALEALEREKGIPKEFMLERVEAALLTGYKKENNNEANVRIAIDTEKRKVKMYRLMTVVEEVTDPTCELDLETARKKSKRAKIGDVQEYEFKPKNFGRSPAQNAKQVIVQGIREAERGRLIEEYEKKLEDATKMLDTLMPEKPKKKAD